MRYVVHHLPSPSAPVTRRQSRFEQRYHAVRTIRAGDTSPSARATVVDALTAPEPLLVAAAARAAQDLGSPELGPAVASALSRSLIQLDEHGHKADPGCTAKLALVEALDALAPREDGLLLRCARLRQWEWDPGVQARVDVAGRVRARAALALVNRDHPASTLILAEHLGDDDARLRQETVDTLGYLRGEVAVALLALRLAAGEPDPEVRGAVFAGLIKLNPDYGVQKAIAALESDDPDDRSCAALALAASHLPTAAPALIAWRARSITAAERALAITALGMHRSEAARDTLLDEIAEGDRVCVEAAIHALATFSRNPELDHHLRAAAARSVYAGVAWLDRALAAAAAS